MVQGGHQPCQLWKARGHRLLYQIRFLCNKQAHFSLGTISRLPVVKCPAIVIMRSTNLIVDGVGKSRRGISHPTKCFFRNPLMPLKLVVMQGVMGVFDLCLLRYHVVALSVLKQNSFVVYCKYVGWRVAEKIIVYFCLVITIHTCNAQRLPWMNRIDQINLNLQYQVRTFVRTCLVMVNVM